MILNRLYTEFKNRGLSGFLVMVLRRITKPLSLLLYKLFRLLPLIDELIVFRTEVDFWDNGWAFYNYLKHNSKRSSQCFVWLVDNPDKYPKENHTKFVSFAPPGIHLKAYYYIARAHYIFFTHGMGIVPLTKREGQLIINLSHGCGYKNTKGVSKSLKANYDYAMVVSSFFIDSQSRFLQCEKGKILPLGYPRNDLLLHSADSGSSNPLVRGINFKKLLLWMPTYRASKLFKLSEIDCDSETGLPLLVNNKMLQEFDNFLREQKVVVLLKIHYLQAEKETFKNKYSNIIIIKEEDLIRKGLQLYQIVGKTDALLTDYSSVATDYLMLDKPIGFILDDLEEYINNRGFVFDDVTSIMPGNHIYNLKDLYDFVKSVSEDLDQHREWRSVLRKSMFDTIDDRSSQRIADFFGI